MSSRSPLPLILGLAVVAAAACDEFPEPTDTDAGLVPVTIQPVDWPAELAVQGSATFGVAVLDNQDRAIQDAPVAWSIFPDTVGTLRETGSDDLTRELQSADLGWARITVTVSEEPFVEESYVDSIPILLAGVAITDPTGDTTLTALGQQLTLSAAGYGTEQNLMFGTNGLTWELVSGGAVTASSTQGPQIQVQADTAGTAVLVVSHSKCVSTGSCSDTITVTVDQQVDSVDVTTAADTVVAGDTIQLEATGFDANANAAPAGTFTWSSRDTAIATVDNTGQVVARDSGQTWVVAEAETGAADSANIHVNASGVMNVDLTDAPADLLKSAMLYLNGVYVLDDAESNGRRYLTEQSFSRDLLTLADTVAALASGRVPVGTYNDLFLALDSVRITLLDSLTFSDSTKTRVFTVPGDTLAAAINGSATFAGNDTIEVVLDFDVDGSFPMPEPSNGVVSSVSFEPTTRVVDRTDAASVAGSVSTTGAASVGDLAMRAVRTDVAGDTVYTRTDAGGAFEFRYLIPGSYDLTLPRPPACHVPNPAQLSISLAAGEAATGAAFSVDSVAIDSMSISPATDTINAIGFSTTLSAVAYEGTTALAGLAVEWSSADPSLATVDSRGTVTGLAVGDARIVAAACGASDTTLVTVHQLPADVTISPESPAIDAGSTQQFTAELVDSGGTAIDTATFTWTSLDTTVATVDAAGLATAIRSGTATIEAQHAASGLLAGTELNVLLASAESFSLGPVFGCALTGTNQVVCWGANPRGGLGFPADDWETPYAPQTIALSTSETYTQVSVGQAHACALTSAGEIYCWGSGGSGELGNGGNLDSSDPVPVTQPTGETFTDVAAGPWFTCAATASGRAYCWGSGYRGKLGNGSDVSVNVPTAVSQSSGLELFDVTIGSDDYACAIGTDDAGYCWGAGDEGQLGNGKTSDSFVPVGVSMPATSFTELALGGNRSCALGADASVYCWGRNSANGLRDDSTTPQQVGSETFVTIGAAGEAVCGAKSDGTVLCDGSNYYAQFGNGTVGDDQSVIWEPGASGIAATMLDGAESAHCALDTGGDVYCWGWKGSGLTGTGQASYTASPLQVDLAGVTAVGASEHRGCAVTDLNEVYCWSDVGHLTGYASGLPQQMARTPYQVNAPPTGETFTAVETGWSHTCALSDAGEIYCIGDNYVGQIGDGTTDFAEDWTAVPHPTGGTWTELATGVEFNCALDSAGDVYCWGYDGDGQLGDGTPGDESLEPTAVFDVAATYTSVEAGGYHACATTSGSTIFCWGWNGWGHLGTGDTSNRSTPTEINTGGNFYDRVSAGYTHTCALTIGDEAYCWGRNYQGELGDGASYDYSTTPVAVAGSFLFDAIIAGDRQLSCGIEAGGTVRCWGSNWNGQMGNGTTDGSTTPVEAWTGHSLVDLDITASGTACGLDANGQVYCTGNHEHFDTGVGEAGYELTPVRVGGSGGS